MPFIPKSKKRTDEKAIGQNYALAYYVWDTIQDVFEYQLFPKYKSKLIEDFYVTVEKNADTLKINANMKETTKHWGYIFKYIVIELEPQEIENFMSIMGIVTELAEDEGTEVKNEMNEGHLIWIFRRKFNSGEE